MADDDFERQDYMWDELDTISRLNGYGELSSAMQNLFYGINLSTKGSPIIYNRDNPGHIFFTRPRLNLSYHNCLLDRRFLPLLTNTQTNTHRAIRALLDPVSNRGTWIDKTSKNFSADDSLFYQKVDSPLVDPYNCFIPMFTNLVTNASGWPDFAAGTYTSPAGRQKEEWSMYDGPSAMNEIRDLNFTFRNVATTPVTLMLQYWIWAGLNQYNGDMWPYPDANSYKEKEYESAIYRVILDHKKKTVQEISRFIAFPLTVPNATNHNFNIEDGILTENKTVSCQWRAQAFDINDGKIVEDFNDVVQMFNYNMRLQDPTDPFSNVLGIESGDYIKITADMRNVASGRSYPRINPITMELEWYLDRQSLPNFASLMSIVRGQLNGQ